MAVSGTCKKDGPDVTLVPRRYVRDMLRICKRLTQIKVYVTIFQTTRLQVSNVGYIVYLGPVI